MSNFTNKIKETADRVVFLAKKKLSTKLTDSEEEDLRAGAIDCATYASCIINMRGSS